MKTIEQLETELRDALAQVRQLREALKRIAEDVGFGHDNLCDIAEASLSAPAPRVFTVEEVRPLVEALKIARRSIGWESLDNEKVMGPVDAALTHARKLGMEGGE